jgi:hypothetical protein
VNLGGIASTLEIKKGKDVIKYPTPIPPPPLLPLSNTS